MAVEFSGSLLSLSTETRLSMCALTVRLNQATDNAYGEVSNTMQLINE